MFSRSQNLLITGGVYTDGSTHLHEAKPRGIDILLEASAPGAFHDSGERFDPPKCHPRTRTYILTKIMNWIVGEVGWDEFIMWLYGPAGAGKSAIAQTIAELCHARRLLLASFFFSRTDPKRNNEKSLIASIAYQIAMNLPAAKDIIEAAIECDPAIFHRSVTVQLTTLIIDPLVQLAKADIVPITPIPNLIIIDGLDECHGRQVQQHIVHSVSTALRQSSVPLKFLICSRPEPHLTLEFTSLMSGGMATCLSLDDGYEQNADIERYLTDSFHKISTTHRLKTYIPTSWPSPQVLSTLVRKSSGQFIYAATVIKYISSDRHQPTRRLEIILGMQPPRNDRPFAELDALYMGILSSVEDVKSTIRLLGFLILAEGLGPKTPEVVGGFMFLDPGEIECLLLHLTSVVECVDKDTEIRMLHASFPDFLLDRSRSEEYHIDSSKMHSEIAQLCLSHVRAPRKHCQTWLEESRLSSPITDYAYFNIQEHLSKSETSADLREALFNTDYITSLIKLEQPGYSSLTCYLLAEFLSFLKDSKLTNTEQLYLHHYSIYDGIIRTRISNFPSHPEIIIFLVLLELEEYSEFELDPEFTSINYFPQVEGGNVRSLYLCPTEDFEVCHNYSVLLREYLSHSVFVLDGSKCALVARFFLDCFIQPSPEHDFLGCVDLRIAFRIFKGIETLLSKAGHSDELVARINHNLIFDFKLLTERFPNLMDWYDCQGYEWEETLQPFIKGIGNYLKRVTGSVSMGLHVTFISEKGERQLYYYDTDSV